MGRQKANEETPVASLGRVTVKSRGLRLSLDTAEHIDSALTDALLLLVSHLLLKTGCQIA